MMFIKNQKQDFSTQKGLILHSLTHHHYKIRYQIGLILFISTVVLCWIKLASNSSINQKYGNISLRIYSANWKVLE